MALTALQAFPAPSFTLSSSAQDPQSNNCSTDDSSLRVPLAVAYSLLFLLGLVGNLLALWVFLCLHSKKNSVWIFLINLAMADLLLVICLPLRVVYHANHDHWAMPPALCKFVGNAFYINMYMSIGLLGLISIDRYIKLQKVSRRQRFLSRRQSIFTCWVLWVLAIGMMVSLMVLAKDHTEPNKCFHYRRLIKDKWKGYFNLAVVFAFWVVYGVLVMSYVKIAKGLFQVSQKKPDLLNAANYSTTARKTFFILFLFTVCFVPYHLVRTFYIFSQIMDVSCQWIKVVTKTNEVALLLSALNSCLDPIMYFLLCGSVRKVMLRMFRNTFCLEASGGFNTSSNEIGTNQNDHQTDSQTNTLRRKYDISSP